MARFLPLIALLLQPPALLADEPPLVRWALIATEEVVDSGLVDLLTVELSRRQAVQLVERETLQTAMRELQLSALVHAEHVPQRLQLGKTLRANALMVLSIERRQERRTLRAVVCDADNGVRLWRGGFDFPDNAAVEKLVPHCVATIDEVRQRFAGGVRQVIAVTPFLSDDFGVRFEYLQTRCSDLLTSSLMSRAGVAVVEIDEARAVLRELENTPAGGLERPVATVVKATYVVAPPDQQGRRFVQLTLDLVHGDDRHERIEKQIALDALDAWLLAELAPRLLGGRRPGTAELSADAQKEILCRHAQRFAELGAWDQSIPLREAALVLDPRDALQRALAISEYQHRNRPDPDRIWELSQSFQQRSGASRPVPQDPARAAPPSAPQDHRENAFRRAADDFRVGFEHLAYLVRNRLLGRVDAIGMFGQHAWYESYAVRAARFDDPLKVEMLQPACAAQRAFIRDVFPLVEELPEGRRLPKHLSDPYYGGRYELARHVARDVIFNRYDPASLASLRDVLLRQLPSRAATDDVILGLFHYGHVPQPGAPGFDAWRELLTDLTGSDRELARLYGRFGWAAERNSPAEFEALLEEVKRLGRDDEPVVRAIRLRLKRPIDQPPVAPTAPRPRGDLGPWGRVQLEPIALVVDGEGEAEKPLRILGVQRCGERDVVWTKDRFFVMDQPGLLREWKLTEATADHALFWEVSWDGGFVWLHAHGQGILVVRPDGTRLASFRDDLPGYWKGHRLIGLSPRRALMAGCLGETERAWCGLLEVDDAGRPTVNVFFEAKRVAAGRTPAQASADVTTAFRPDGISRAKRADGRELVLVERHGLSPLCIDVTTLEVTVPDTNGGLAGLSTLASRGFAGRRFLRDGRPIWVNSGVASTPASRQMVFDDGWLYRPGLVWMRQHTATGTLERLQADPLPPEHRNLRVGSSAHYGLIAWDPHDDARPLERVTILNERGEDGREDGEKSR